MPDPRRAASRERVEVLDHPIEVRLRWDGEKPTELHKKLLSYITDRRQASENAMSDRIEVYTEVDNHNNMYIDLAQRPVKGDGSADTKGWQNPFPYGIVIPAMRAALEVRLVQEFDAFVQRDPMVELSGAEPGDIENAKRMEAIIARDHRKWDLELLIWDLLNDVERYNLGIIYDTWDEEIGTIVHRPKIDRRQVPPWKRRAWEMFGNLMGGQPPWEPTVEWGLRDESCRYHLIDPRRFWCDPNFVLGRQEHASYAGHREDAVRVDELKRSEWTEANPDGVFFNLAQARRAAKNRPKTDAEETTAQESVTPGAGDYGAVAVDWFTMIVIPRELHLSGLERPQKWCFATINDEVIVRAHEQPNWHDELPYSVVQGNPDPHVFAPLSNCELMLGLQRTIDWFSNAHIEAAKKRVNNAAIIVPEAFHMPDITGENHTGYIRTSHWASKRILRGQLSIQQIRMQIEESPTTHALIQDAFELFDWLQRFMAASDPQMGQPLPSKRTLGEVERVTTSGAQRILKVVRLAEKKGLKKTVDRHIANRQQFTSMRQWVRIVGELARHLEGTNGRLLIEGEDLWGHFDFVARAGLSAQDPGRVAQNYLSLLDTIARNGELIFGGQGSPDGSLPNINAIIKEAAQAGGIRQVEHLFWHPNQQAPQVRPDEEVRAGLEAGNLVPLSQFGELPDVQS